MEAFIGTADLDCWKCHLSADLNEPIYAPSGQKFTYRNLLHDFPIDFLVIIQM